MPSTDPIATELRSRGFRLTPQRLTILQVLRRSGGHLTPAEIFELASQGMPGLTEPTVYRTLEFLVENGFALAAHTGSGSGKLVYEASGHDHHHIVCRGCGFEMEIPHSQLSDLYQQIEQSTGYKLTTSHLTFSGLCPGCQ